MKRSPVLMLLAAPLLLSVLAFRSSNKAELVGAYDKTKLPTTIDLNDYEESDIRSYYSALNDKDESERKGTNLLKSLKPILKKDQQYFSYDNSKGTDIYKMYEITDRDWDKSPAKDIAGYDASTNTITGYKYGSNSDAASNPYLHALYVNREADNKMHAWKTESGSISHGNNAEWCIDREHIWPKSHGFEDSTSDPAEAGARGDPIHLWAGDSSVNSDLHSNYYYGYVDTTRPYKDGKDKWAYTKGNLRGYSKTLGGNVTVFEPQLADKGDIARAIFYMVARYNNLAGDDVIDNDNPNLELINEIKDWSEYGYISTSTKTGKMAIAKDLLKWNIDDPVDGYEVHRNNLLYRNFTHNRNPFIDFPEWADYIWGENADEKYADPLKDVIPEPVDYVPQTRTDDGDDLLFGLPRIYVYIGAAVLGVMVLGVVVTIAAKGSKKQKKTLKKIGKKVIKSSTKGKK